MFSIGFRPSQAEYKALKRVCNELNCTRSDLLRVAARDAVNRFADQGLVTARLPENALLGR